MKGLKRKSIIALLAAVVMCVMSACGEPFDAGAYVKACLDAQFKGEYTEYVEITESTESDAEKLYNEGLDDLMAGYDSMAISDELNQKFRNAYAEMLKSAKYSVKEAKEDGENFIVVVAVEPMTCFETYAEDMLELQEKFIAEWKKKAMKGKKVPKEDELMELLAEKIYDDFVERIKDTEYGEEKTIEVRVTKDSKKIYTANEEDLAKIAEAAFGLE